ncbi:sensor histidine kinase [Paenibacillus sp.]|uniref:cache domain-containing sensor histidine kinase n=1 Tax=Paenibacillus sp. TaxID=58172 RepID=UPI002D56E27D|nr:sensor histidine kinase [Paenibacillus sp.]HZG55015.1 sensor histidine kinase [Paenibacillus sp.]
MKHLLQRWLLRQLSTKLIFTILLLLSFAIAFISTLYSWASARMIADNVRASTKQSAKQSADYLSLLLAIGSDMGQQISRDARIQQVIQEEAQGGLTVDQKFDHKDTVNNILNNVMYTSSFVRSVYLLRAEGSSWGSGMFNASKVMRYTLTEHAWYNDVVSGRTDDLWLPLQYDPFSGGGENTELVLTFVKPLRNFATREAVGAIVVNLDGQRILQAVDRIRLGKTGRFFVVDGRGEVVVASEPSSWERAASNAELDRRLRAVRAEEAEFETDVDGARTYVVTRKLDNGWTIVGTVPVAEIIGDIERIQRTIWLYAGVLLAFASLVGYMFSRRITSPLKHLMKQMKEIEKSNFKALSEVASQDEIGQLSHRFNQMVRQIEILVEQVNRVEAKKREAEMRALRHQINPHFLYNTLTSIRWMIKFGRKEGAYDGISALVQLMEASMEKKGVFYRIRDELELLEKYMVIQRFRYGDGIRLEVECPEHLLDVSIPRMLLQPIVENAVFHGLAPKTDGGTVKVMIEASNDAPESNAEIAGDSGKSGKSGGNGENGGKLVLRVEDDGLGIPAERIGGLLQRTGQPRSGAFGIGLNHVHETIQLYYGDRSGVSIESEPGAGTRIRLELRRAAGERDAV